MFTKFHNNAHPVLVIATYYTLTLAAMTGLLFGAVAAAMSVGIL